MQYIYKKYLGRLRLCKLQKQSLITNYMLVISLVSVTSLVPIFRNTNAFMVEGNMRISNILNNAIIKAKQ